LKRVRDDEGKFQGNAISNEVPKMPRVASSKRRKSNITELKQDPMFDMLNYIRETEEFERRNPDSFCETNTKQKKNKKKQESGTRKS